MKKNTWVNGLDSLRFFLALVVVLSHMPNPIAITLKASNHYIFKSIGYFITPMFNGVGAVIAFFIISGFVIHYPNKNKKIDYWKFLIRRWVRLGIPMIVVSVFTIHYGIFAKIPIWSLYCELIYYTLYPLLVKTKISWNIIFWLAFGIASTLIVTLCYPDIQSLIYQKNLHFFGSYWQLGTELTWAIGLPCWLLGVILAEHIDSYTYKVTALNIYTWRAVVLLTSMVIQIARYKYFLSWIVSMNLFAFLLFFWLRNEIIYYRDHKSVPFFERLGKFSYSLYLTHELVVMGLMFYIPFNFYTYLLYILLCVASSYIIYLFLEKPSHLLAQKISTFKKSADNNSSLSK